MPLYSLIRTAAAVALAVPALVGLSAVAASADDVTTVQAPVVTPVTETPAPVTDVPAPATEAPPLMTAFYTRW